MTENIPDNIPGITQRFNGRKTGKKTRRKPLSPTRAVYEEDFPPLGVRIPRGAHLQVHLDAQHSNMTLSEYVTSLIEKRHENIEQIKAASFKEGSDSRQKEVDEAFNRGKAQGVANNAERIRREGIREGEQRTALFVWCANWSTCRNMIPIERDTELAEIAINAVWQQRRFICKTCEYNAIMGRYR